MRTVLLVTRYFPPAGGIAAVRWSKLAKYLLSHNWRTVVLTATVDGTQATDRLDTSLSVESTVDVFRAQAVRIEPWLGKTRLGQWLRRGRPRHEAGDRTHSDDEPRPSRAARLRGWVFPDADAGWIRPGQKLGRDLARDIAPDIIYSSSPPVSAHLIARKVARASGVPWIVELRDPWSEHPLLPSKLHRRLHRYIEAQAMAEASAVIAVVPKDAEALVARYPGLAHRCHVVTNGFDPADFPRSPTPRGNRFVIRHVGSFYRSRHPSSLLNGIRLALDARPDLADELSLEFIGHSSPSIAAHIDAFSKEHGLSTLVHQQPFVPHREAVSLMQSANLLVLLLGREFAPVSYPGKLFEYLGTGRPILVDTDDGPAAALVRELGAGRCVGGGAKGLATAIVDHVERWREQDDTTVSWTERQRFAHPEIARTLSGILDAVAEERARS